MRSIVEWMLAHQAIAKSTGFLAGGSGILALIFSLHGDIKTDMARGDSQVKQYVDLKVDNIESKVESLEKGQDEIKILLKTIDKRLYDLNQKK